MRPDLDSAAEELTYGARILAGQLRAGVLDREAYARLRAACLEVARRDGLDSEAAESAWRRGLPRGEQDVARWRAGLPLTAPPGEPAAALTTNPAPSGRTAPTGAQHDRKEARP